MDITIKNNDDYNNNDISNVSKTEEFDKCSPDGMISHSWFAF